MINDYENEAEKKQKSQRCNLNRPSPRQCSKYILNIKCDSICKQYVLYISKIEAQFMKMLSNTETELKKCCLYKKGIFYVSCVWAD